MEDIGTAVDDKNGGDPSSQPEQEELTEATAGDDSTVDSEPQLTLEETKNGDVDMETQEEDSSSALGTSPDRSTHTGNGGTDPSPSSKNNGNSSEDDSDVSSDSKTSYEGTPPAKKARRSRTEHLDGNPAIRSHASLKKTREPFLQTKSCSKLKHALGKCLECRSSRSSGKDNVCRFFAFRKLRYTERGSMTVAGFPDITDCLPRDLKVWMPDEIPEELSLELAKFLVTALGDQFCDLVKHEKESILDNETQENRKIVWRRTVNALRELCDVCSTTLFNYHWTCSKCGFVVCISCFKSRRQNVENASGLDAQENVVEGKDNKDGFGWIKCHLKGEHKIEQLILTQIVAGKALDILWRKLHVVREKLGIIQRCECDQAVLNIRYGVLFPNSVNLGTSNNQTDKIIDNTNSSREPDPKPSIKSDNGEVQKESLEPIKEVIDKENMKDDDSDNEDEQDGIADLLGDESDTGPEEQGGKSDDEVQTESKIEDISASQKLECSETETFENKEMELQNYIRPKGSSAYKITVVPKKVITSSESNRLYPDTPHGWLCDGHLLRLLDPVHPGNFQMFQEQWKRGQPVLVSNVAKRLDPALWSPESFSHDFGHKTAHFINCMTGKIVPGRKLKKFWDGFEYMRLRLKDDNDQPMLLKLKDWPPSADFAEVLPRRFDDLMRVLPLGEYTHRDGKLNLAARLPDVFSKPDLGPKMYIAYGSGLHLDKGTTNLHLDVSDAVNVMVYVGVVKDQDNTEHNNAVMSAIEDSDCDKATINRIRKSTDLPGALWHIWEAKDADKIRDLLNKVALEKGKKIEQYHDAIHDQSWYLDKALRARLMNEYNVRGYPILQCAGDSVFVPAGAPHQVRNLNNCIKIAEDFVSPENVRHCFHLTEEFRNLTETHTNHEDKLQIKNIVYHTIKDALAVIEASLNNPTDVLDEPITSDSLEKNE